MIPLWLAISLIFFTIGPGMWIIVYFSTIMYTSDQIDDMEDREEISWIKATLLREKMYAGEYKLYPRLIHKLTNKEESK